MVLPTICSLSFKQQILAFTKALPLLMTSYLFHTCLKVHSLRYIKALVVIPINPKKIWLCFHCALLSLPSLPRVPVHHMLPWVLICLCSSPSHSGGLDRCIRCRCTANLKHRLKPLDRQREHIVTCLENSDSTIDRSFSTLSLSIAGEVIHLINRPVSLTHSRYGLLVCLPSPPSLISRPSRELAESPSSRESLPNTVPAMVNNTSPQ